MSGARYSTVNGLLLHAQAYKETSFLCTFISAEKGRIRCVLDRAAPEYFREFEVKISEQNQYMRSSGYRYVQPLIISSNPARLQGLYLNELLYRLLPIGIADTALYGAYLSTLHYLQQQTQVTQALRFFERQLLAFLGQGIDYQRLLSGEPIQPELRYGFQAQAGFRIEAQGRYRGAQILAVAEQQYQVGGSLSLARECQQQQLAVLLGDLPLHSRQWFVFANKTDGEHQ